MPVKENRKSHAGSKALKKGKKCERCREKWGEVEEGHTSDDKTYH